MNTMRSRAWFLVVVRVMATDGGLTDHTDIAVTVR